MRVPVGAAVLLVTRVCVGPQGATDAEGIVLVTRAASEHAFARTPVLGDEVELTPVAAAFGASPRDRARTKKSYWIPIVDIVGFEVALNLVDRHFADAETYGTDFDSISHNLRRGWVIDHDPFETNQLLHPYQGATYHGFARSAGLSYWESLAYDFGASALWEVAGETDPPSFNDQVTTSFGGSFLGEALFRMSNLLLESGGERPGFARRFAALLISTSTGFNRFAYGSRFDAVYPSRDPATYLALGAGFRQNRRLSDLGVERDVQRDGAVVGARMDYGLPGRASYEYSRPFDYFHFETLAASNTSGLVETLSVRGLLWGSDYDWGESYRGLWGLYGTYDYLSPGLFSVSSTALGVGTTAQWWMSDAIALQHTVLVGGGWAAAGTIADAQDDRDYHYGASPLGLVDVAVIFGDAVRFDLTVRDVYVSRYGSQDRGAAENIVRGEAELLVRIAGHHALAVQLAASSRSEHFLQPPDADQAVGSLEFFYTWLGDETFGAVPWGEHGR